MKPWILWALVSTHVVIQTLIFSGIIFLLLNVSAYKGIEFAADNATSAIAHVEWTGTNMILIPFAIVVAIFVYFVIALPYFAIFKSLRAAETAFPLSAILSIPIGITAFIVFGLIF